MANALKTLIKDYLIPPGYLRLARSITNGKIIEDPEIQSPTEVIESAESNSSFKDIHTGERCFILATGPSVAEQDLKPLKDEYCISVSHFFLHPDIATIRPQYHVLAPYHAPFLFKDADVLHTGIKESIAQNAHIFLGHYEYKYSHLNYFKTYISNTPPNYSYINYQSAINISDKNHTDDSLWDISGHPFNIRTVIYIAIQVAVYMGFKEIYLNGCDHDYLKDISRVENHHFYKEEDGVSDKENLSAFDLERWFDQYHQRWMHYRLMKQYAESRSVHIYNATHETMLDVFPRVKFESLF